MGCCNATPDVASRELQGGTEKDADAPPQHPEKSTADEAAVVEASRRLDGSLRAGSVTSSNGNISVVRDPSQKSANSKRRGSSGTNLTDGKSSTDDGNPPVPEQTHTFEDLPSKCEEEETKARQEQVVKPEIKTWESDIAEPALQWRRDFDERKKVEEQQLEEAQRLDLMNEKYEGLYAMLVDYEDFQRTVTILEAEASNWGQLLVEEKEANTEVLRQLAEEDSIDGISTASQEDRAAHHDGESDLSSLASTAPTSMQGTPLNAALENVFPTANLLAQIDDQQMEEESYHQGKQADGGKRSGAKPEAPADGAAWNLFFSGDHMSPGERSRMEKRQQLEAEEAEAQRLERLEMMRCPPSQVMKRLDATQPTLALHLEEAKQRDHTLREQRASWKQIRSGFFPVLLLFQHEEGRRRLVAQFDASYVLALQRIESQRRLCIEDACFKEAFFALAEKCNRFVAARKEWQREKAAIELRADDHRLGKLAARGVLGGRRGAKGLRGLDKNDDQREQWKKEMLRLGKTSRNATPATGLRSQSGSNQSSPTKTVVNAAHITPNPRNRLLEKMSFGARSTIEQEEFNQKAAQAVALVTPRSLQTGASPTGSKTSSARVSHFSTPTSAYAVGTSADSFPTSAAPDVPPSKLLDSLKPHAPSLERLRKKLAPVLAEEQRARDSVHLESNLRWDLICLDHVNGLHKLAPASEEDAANNSNKNSRPGSAVRKKITTVREYEAEMSKVRQRLAEIETGTVKEKYLTNQAASLYLCLEHDEGKQRAKIHRTELQDLLRLGEESRKCKAVAAAHDARRARVEAEKQAIIDQENKVQDCKRLIARVATNAIFRQQRLAPLYKNRELALMIIRDEHRAYKLLMQYENMDRFDIVEYFDLIMAQDCEERGIPYTRLTSAFISPQSIPAVESILRANLAKEFADSFQQNIVNVSDAEAAAIALLPPEKIGYRVRAVTNIQRVWRGYRSRCNFVANQKDGLIILRMGRLQTKQNIRYIKEIEHLRRVCIEDDWTDFDLFGHFFETTILRFELERGSAIKIQSLWRGYFYRRRVFPKYQEEYYSTFMSRMKANAEKRRAARAAK